MVLSGAAAHGQEPGSEQEHAEEGDLEAGVLHAQSGPSRLETGRPSRLADDVAGDVFVPLTGEAINR